MQRGRQVVISIGIVRVARHRLLEFLHGRIVLPLLVQAGTLHVLTGGHHVTATTGRRSDQAKRAGQSADGWLGPQWNYNPHHLGTSFWRRQESIRRESVAGDKWRESNGICPKRQGRNHVPRQEGGELPDLIWAVEPLNSFVQLSRRIRGLVRGRFGRWCTAFVSPGRSARSPCRESLRGSRCMSGTSDRWHVCRPPEPA